MLADIRQVLQHVNPIQSIQCRQKSAVGVCIRNPFSCQLERDSKVAPTELEKLQSDFFAEWDLWQQEYSRRQKSYRVEPLSVVRGRPEAGPRTNAKVLVGRGVAEKVARGFRFAEGQ